LKNSDMNMSKAIILVLIHVLLVSVTGLEAQTIHSLPEVIEISLQNQKRISVSRNILKIADNAKHPGNTGLLPKVDVSANLSETKANTSLKFAGSLPPVERNGAHSDASGASIGLTYTLFDGMANFQNLQKLKIQYQIADLRSKNEIDFALFQVIMTYYEVARLKDAVEILRNNLTVSAERLNKLKLKREFGSVTSIEFLNAKVDFNTDSISFLKSFTDLENSARNLSVLMGYEPDKLIFPVSIHIPGKVLTIDDVVENVSEQNNTLAGLRHAVRMAEIEHKLAQSGFYPKLSFSGNYGTQRNTSDASIVLENTSTGMSYGLTISMNLFDGYKKNIAARNTAIAMENSKFRLDMEKIELERDVRNTFALYQHSLTAITLEEENNLTADANLLKSKELYNTGQITGTQFREAQLNLEKARQRLSTARYSAKLFESELFLLQGNLFVFISSQTGL
jgi:outer membrane protein